MAANETQKFLDNLTGLPTLWTLIKNKFVQKEYKTGSSSVYKVLSDNNFTDTLKSKLDNIEANAEVNQNAFSNVIVGETTIEADSKTDTLTLTAGSNITLTGNASTDTVTIAATDTTYSDATTSTSGLMSSGDKTKLNGIATGAEVNQNAFSNVAVGETTIAADAKTDTLTIVAGSNVTLTPNASTDTLTIDATDTTYSTATTSAAGLMSADDKTKLNGVATGAEVNQNAFSNITVGSSTIAADSKTDTLTIVAGSNVTLTPDTSTDTLTVAATDTTYSNATQSTAGLMSAADKTALDNVVAASGEPNQNAFSYVHVGSTTIEAETETDTLNFVAGCNITLTPNASTDTLTIAATDTTYTSFTGATESTDGNSGLVPPPYAGDQNAILFGDSAWLPVILDATPDDNHDKVTLELYRGATIDDDLLTSVNLGAATTSRPGVMTSEDKTKLNGIETGAQANVIETVKVNNSALTPSSKAVNITIAEGSTNGAISVNGSSVSVHGLAGAAYQSVASSISDGGTGLTTSDQVYDFATGLIVQTITSGDTTHVPSADAIYQKISTVYRYKGSVATEASLPSSNQVVGDVYNIEAASSYGPAGMNVAWNGTAWDALGSFITIEAMTAADVEAICV